MARRPILAIANRGEIAIRIAKTARNLGWHPVVLLGDPDLGSLAAREIGDVVPLGPAGSELVATTVVAAAKQAGATALHPGYGFLSERPELSAACEDAGIIFVGPTPQTLSLCGDKIATRTVAQQAGVPVLLASDPLESEDAEGWRDAARAVRLPVIAKVAGGGGGRGLRVARDAEEVEGAVRSALRESGASGAGARIYLEHYLEGARHVEVQVAGDGQRAVALGDRDCSIQRRHQKVIEEAPAFGLSDDLRSDLHRHAVAIAAAVQLRGVATVEFLMSRLGELAFIEVNPRLQVEHTVTEEVTGLDLVAVQINLATGGTLPEPVAPVGHAVQARLYAEDPLMAFAPTPGTISILEWPRLPWLRIDAGYAQGDTIPSDYDSMVGKVITSGRDRDEALDRLHDALTRLRIGGVATNRPWLIDLLDNAKFRAAEHDLATAAEIAASPIPPPSPVLHAIASHVRARQHGDSNAAWGSVGPFRIVSPATLRLHGDDANGWDATVQWHSSDNDGTADAASDRSNTPGIAVVDAPEGIEASSPEGRWIARIGARHAGIRGPAAHDGHIRAPMPGTIVAINATPGEHVAKDTPVVVMTAMKIEMTLAAPFAGTVESVTCNVGDIVNSRQVLATMTEITATGDDDV